MDELKKKIISLAEKHFSRKVKVVFEAGEELGYLAKAELKGKKAVLRVNLAYRQDLVRMIEESYIEALIEHEAAHSLTRPPRCTALDLLAPSGLADLGMYAFDFVSNFITEQFSELCNDAFAIASMREEAAEKYVFWFAYEHVMDFEKRDEMPFGRLKIPWMLVFSFCSAMAEELGAELPRSFERTFKPLFTRPEELAAVSLLKEIFAKAHRAVKSGEEELDLTKECAELRELFFRMEAFEI